MDTSLVQAGTFTVVLTSLNSRFPKAASYPSIESLRNEDDGSNKNGKKAIGLDKQNNNFARASRFFVHFSAIVARLQRETA